jgi:predicted TIM-barrel fold metal-dependent hydrolase
MSADLAAPHSRPHFVVPPSACDCHMHVFGPAERYPVAAGRTYTPRLASLADYSKMAATIGLERVVFVQPSAYGTDNRCLLDAMKQVGRPARGVIGLDETVSEAALRDMDRAGVRGVRLNLASRGFRDAQQIAAMIHATADRIGPLGWHIQLFTDLTVIQALADTFKHAPVSVVFDHMGLADGRLGNTQAGLAVLLGLISAGQCWTKLSGCYRVSTNEPDFPDAGQIVRALIAANADRLVWGTDWPHTAPHGHARGSDPPLIDYRALDDGYLIDLLADWVNDTAALEKVLVTNPARLYGSGEAPNRW